MFFKKVIVNFLPRWWNGIHGGLRSHCRKAWRFESSSGHHIIVMKKLTSNRKCEECTMCCQYLGAEIYGHKFGDGTPCHFLSTSCTIYKDRPAVCSNYICAWLDDKHHMIPEWIKPSMSKIIITARRWGKNKEFVYWDVVECGETMRSDVLHWLLIFCEQNNINLEYMFNSKHHRRGSVEFQQYRESNPEEYTEILK